MGVPVTAVAGGNTSAVGVAPVPVLHNAGVGINPQLALNQSSRGKSNAANAGASSFDFVKLDRSGRPLTNQSRSWRENGNAHAGTKWSCVRDSNTGLTWEVKTDNGGLRDKNWTYTWRPSTKATLSAVAQGKGSCGGTVGPYCDTATYIAAVNATNLCGYHDWRLPTEAELDTLVENKVDSPGPSIDTTWFPNKRKKDYWAAPPYPGGHALAWNAKIDYGYGDYSPKQAYAYFVRLVRGSAPQ